jgi:hypothetical protein
MFGTYFYHQRIRKTVAVFGSLFNNLYVLRKNSAGAVISQVKVPLTYATKDKFLERIAQMNSGEDMERSVAIKLPRMSFEITSVSFDSQRQLNKTNYTSQPKTSAPNVSRHKIYNGVPYDIGFQLNMFAANQDDALQVVEQIIPYFNPQYTITVKPLSDFGTVKEDVPLILQGITFADDYEGTVDSRRTIIYTLDFIMKVAFYKSISDSGDKIIRKVTNPIYNYGAGDKDSDLQILTMTTVPDPLAVNPDSDFGFTTTNDFKDDSAG